MNYTRRNVPWEEIEALPKTRADCRVSYGDQPLQFGDLRLPKGEGPSPVAVFIHGGCWRSAYDLEYTSNISGALADVGFAAWTPEYRRIGNDGGGWPGTFED